MLKIYLKKIENTLYLKNINQELHSIKFLGTFGVIKRYLRKEIQIILNLHHFMLKPLFFRKEIKMLLHNYFFMLKNTLIDLNYGFFVILEVRGVGFKVFSNLGRLTFNLGYSHKVFFELPKNIISKNLDEKNTIFYLMGNDRIEVLLTAIKICKLKNRDPYKGKGIYFYSENKKLKEGKGKKNF